MQRTRDWRRHQFLKRRKKYLRHVLSWERTFPLEVEGDTVFQWSNWHQKMYAHPLWVVASWGRGRRCSCEFCTGPHYKRNGRRTELPPIEYPEPEPPEFDEDEYERLIMEVFGGYAKAWRKLADLDEGVNDVEP